MMVRAEAGDLLAAREVAEILALVVSPTNTYRDPHSDDPNRRIAVPVPDFVRQYLSRALLRIASGADPRDAFYLRKKRGPRPFWAHHDKVLAVDIMSRLVEQGQVVDQAAADAADLINTNARVFTAENLYSPWKQFSVRPIDAATLLTWRYEIKPPSK